MGIMLTENNLEDLTNLMHRCSDSRSMLTEWEAGFIDDFRARFEQYGEAVKISEKQWDILVRIGKKLKVPGMM